MSAIIGASMDRLWTSLITQLARAGMVPTRLGSAVEITDCHLVLLNPRACVLQNAARRFSPGYAFGELLWYLSGSDDVDGFIAKYAPSYKKLVRGNFAYGAYGRRWEEGDQLSAVAEILGKDRYSRQAVVSCWHLGDAAAAANGQEDIPCTLTLQFLIRGGRLNLITTMRSNDAWLGLPYDLFCFCFIQLMMARKLGVEVGTYSHHAGSMHLYDKHWEAARLASEQTEHDLIPIEISVDDPSLVSRAIRDEALIRQHAAPPPVEAYPKGSIWPVALQCCAIHLGATEEYHITDDGGQLRLQNMALATRLKKGAEEVKP